MKKESLSTTMSKLIMAVVLIIGIGAVLGVMGYFLAMEKREVVVNDEVEEEIIQDETVGWKTYRNEEYGYELKYPSELIYVNEYEHSGSVSFRKKKNNEGWQETQSGTKIYVKDGSDDRREYKNYQGGIDVYLERDQFGKDSAEEWVDTNNRVAVGAPEYSPYIKIENIEVDGTKGLIVCDARARGNWDPEGKWNYVAMFFYDDYLFKIGYVSSVSELKQILSVFKFIPKGGNRLDINNIKIGDEIGDFKVESIDMQEGVVKFSGKTVLEGTSTWSLGRYGYTFYLDVSKNYRDKIPKFINNDGVPHIWLIYKDKEAEIFISHPIKIEVSEYTYVDSSNIWGSAIFVREIAQDTAN